MNNIFWCCNDRIDKYIIIIYLKDCISRNPIVNNLEVI